MVAYMKIYKPVKRFILFWAVIIFFYSCSSTKYLKEGQYLLRDNKIHLDSNIVDKSEVKLYAIQKPNRRILGWPMYVSLYNMVNPVKEARRDIERQQKLEKRNEERHSKGKKLKEDPFILVDGGETVLVNLQLFIAPTKLLHPWNK